MTVLPRNILHIEDDAFILQLVQTCLKRQEAGSIGLTQVQTGAAGLAKIKDMEFDLILLDMKLPDMSGAAICAKLEQENRKTPVIIMTGRDDAELETSNVIGLIKKPFPVKDFVIQIEKLWIRASGSFE